MATIYVSDKAKTQLPARKDFDFYPTPNWAASTALKYAPKHPQCILDPGAGSGVWGRAARRRFPNALITGLDVRCLERPRAYNFWYTGDFLLSDRDPAFDLVIGNPPFKYAEQFVRQSWALLEQGGHIIFLLPLDLLSGQERKLNFWRRFPLKKCVVCSSRISFSGDGKSNATIYGFYIWQKGFQGKTLLTID